MKNETVEKRIDAAIKRYIPNESAHVKNYIKDLIKTTFQGLEMDDDGEYHTSSDNLRFAISITLDDMDTPMILKEAREDESERANS